MEGILSKEAVEGVIAMKDSDKKKRKLDKVEGEKRKSTKPTPYYTHYNPNLNVRLTLNAVKFINPGGVASVVDDFERLD